MKKQINIKLGEKTLGQLAELRRILTARLGIEVGQTGAIEMAISDTLKRLIGDSSQLDLFGAEKVEDTAKKRGKKAKQAVAP